MAKSRFKITKFRNPSGEEAYRVSGTLNGERIRKNFPKRSDAVSLREKLDIRYLNETSKGQVIFTTLTPDQNKDAVAALGILKQSGLSKNLSFAAHFLAEHYREAAETKLVEEAVTEYLEEKANEYEREIISNRQYVSIKRELNIFKKVFDGRIIGEILADELRDYLKGKQDHARNAVSLKTWNNRRGYLSTFFKFCLTNKFVGEDPVLEIPQHKIKKARGTAETLSDERAEEFMRWLESYAGRQNKNGSWWGRPGCMVPYYALTLFAGIRPDAEDGEISRLLPGSIRLDTNVILVEPGVSKINEKRVIKIQPNLRLWLERYPLDEFPIIPLRRFKLLSDDVRAKWKLPHDVMRHTYISMTVGAFRSVGDAALQAGNSESIIRKHYLDLKSTEEADQFWRIVPGGDNLPETMEKKDGRYVV